MKIIDTEIRDVKILEPRVFKDERGYFYESFNKKTLQQLFKESTLEGYDDIEFVQDNQSKSTYGVLRGLHFQKPPYAQAKLVRVVQGKVYDVAVDLRKDSPTYRKYVGVELSDENNLQFFIPRGFAHGFVVLSPEAVFQYKCDNYYNKESEGGIAWDDPTIGIDWPIDKKDVILSEKDTNRTTLEELGESPFIHLL